MLIARCGVFKHHHIFQVGHSASAQNIRIKNGLKVESPEQSDFSSFIKHIHFSTVEFFGRRVITPQFIYGIRV
jgi:hypothetical protein